MERDSSRPYRTRKVGWVAFHGFHPSTPPRKDRVPGTPDRGYSHIVPPGRGRQGSWSHSKMRVVTVDPRADVDVRGTAGLPPHGRRPVRGDPGLETRATFRPALLSGRRYFHLPVEPKRSKKPARATLGMPSVVVGVLESSIWRLRRFSPAAKSWNRLPKSWDA